jgi:signal transduction histidine kinase
LQPSSDSAELWLFINRLPDVILWQTDEAGDLRFVSDGLGALLGSSEAGPERTPALWLDRVSRGHRRRHQRALQTARENRTYIDIEYRARLPGVGTTWLRDHIIAEPSTGALFGVTTQSSELHDTTERLAFLNKAARLFANSLDSVQLLEQLGNLIVGSLANVCIIELQQAEAPLVVVRTDAGKRIRAGLEREGPLILDGRPVPPRLKQGRAILYEKLTPRRLRTLLGATRAGLFDAKLPHAAIIAPLSVRRRSLGTVTFLCTDLERQYTGKDLDLARDVCSHAAIALDHARLFEEAALEQEKLATENEMKDEFLALMSHELRTPLTLIFGVSRLLPRILPPLGEDATELMNDLHSASERTVRLVDDLMLLARINLGGKPELEAVPVSPLFTEVVDAFERQYPERKLTLDNQAEGSTVKGSQPYIRQVLLNLLSNAHKYSPPAGLIELNSATEADSITFTVLDSGSGVPEAELVQLFDRFYRASNSEGVPGTGMGLAICKRLIEALEGKIWATNHQPQGLAVSFSLPLA